MLNCVLQQAIGYVGADLAALAREAALSAAARTHKAAVAALSDTTIAVTAAAQQPDHTANTGQYTAASIRANTDAGATAAKENGTAQMSDSIAAHADSSETLSSSSTTATTADVSTVTASTAAAAAASSAAATSDDDSSHSVQLCDFEAAMECVGASSLRGHRVDVPQTLWEHIGGMDEVRHHLNSPN
jgi:SpoVK/Ycf46/Vps4 family AAA+-type ATPase